MKTKRLATDEQRAAWIEEFRIILKRNLSDAALIVDSVDADQTLRNKNPTDKLKIKSFQELLTAINQLHTKHAAYSFDLNKPRVDGIFIEAKLNPEDFSTRDRIICGAVCSKSVNEFIETSHDFKDFYLSKIMNLDMAEAERYMNEKNEFQNSVIPSIFKEEIEQYQQSIVLCEKKMRTFFRGALANDYYAKPLIDNHIGYDFAKKMATLSSRSKEYNFTFLSTDEERSLFFQSLLDEEVNYHQALTQLDHILEMTPNPSASIVRNEIIKIANAYDTNFSVTELTSILQGVHNQVKNPNEIDKRLIDAADKINNFPIKTEKYEKLKAGFALLFASAFLIAATTACFFSLGFRGLPTMASSFNNISKALTTIFTGDNTKDKLDQINLALKELSKNPISDKPLQDELQNESDGHTTDEETSITPERKLSNASDASFFSTKDDRYDDEKEEDDDVFSTPPSSPRGKH